VAVRYDMSSYRRATGVEVDPLAIAIHATGARSAGKWREVLDNETFRPFGLTARMELSAFGPREPALHMRPKMFAS
jgi:type IV pilus biogenesis protein CpaD/CtpE